MAEWPDFILIHHWAFSSVDFLWISRECRKSEQPPNGCFATEYSPKPPNARIYEKIGGDVDNQLIFNAKRLEGKGLTGQSMTWDDPSHEAA
ncbi:MAG: hypothetical protein GXP25_19500 [Planctomycetes bacterium]|nr:hypothetical protein [Planctomycetota bacterium]